MNNREEGYTRRDDSNNDSRYGLTAAQQWAANLSRVSDHQPHAVYDPQADKVTRLEGGDRGQMVKDGLAAAADEMRDLRDQLDQVEDRLRSLKSAAGGVGTTENITNLTLDWVWDRLMHEGHYEAATVVLKMKSRA